MLSTSEVSLFAPLADPSVAGKPQGVEKGGPGAGSTIRSQGSTGEAAAGPAAAGPAGNRWLLSAAGSRRRDGVHHTGRQHQPLKPERCCWGAQPAGPELRLRKPAATAAEHGLCPDDRHGSPDQRPAPGDRDQAASQGSGFALAPLSGMTPLSEQLSMHDSGDPQISGCSQAKGSRQPHRGGIQRQEGGVAPKAVTRNALAPSNQPGLPGSRVNSDSQRGDFSRAPHQQAKGRSISPISVRSATQRLSLR
jgi:hypothetical protein